MLPFLVELAVIATLSFHAAGSIPAGTQQQAPSGPPTIGRFPGLVVTEEPEAVDMPGRLAQVDAAIRCRIEFSEVIAVSDPNARSVRGRSQSGCALSGYPAHRHRPRSH